LGLSLFSVFMERALDLDGVQTRLRRAIALRAKYTPTAVQPGKEEKLEATEHLRCDFKDGVLRVLRFCTSCGREESVLMESAQTLDEFYRDMSELLALRTDPAVGTFTYQRLKLLQTRFDLHTMANFDIEAEEMMDCPHRDFYNVRKVDTHIHHSAAMNGKHLLRFIKKKLKTCGSEAVMNISSEQPKLLKEVCDDCRITASNLSLDKLNVVADQTVFHRFDNFNRKYSPCDQPELRNIFLKTDNEIKGRYLAEITREMLDDLEDNKYQHTEWRLSIYGRKRDEWEKLSRWVLNNNLVSPNNRWMIQVPRLYTMYKASGQINCFQDMLDNIFIPMFEATADPTAHPEVAKFLDMVSGFDCVDDESKAPAVIERTFSSRQRTPATWSIVDNPSYKYYNYFLQANLRVLNRLRAALGKSQFMYRPHAGEAGEMHHLDTAFLLADSINHGIQLSKSYPLQYLYYLCNIGLAMSPCSNNHLFVSYGKHPFKDFFSRGLNVSLSTDDPLMFHQTKEPLMEEYSLAKQFFRLGSADLCELARNSVLQSGFSRETIASWLGSADPTVNNITRTNLPAARFNYRQKCLAEERWLVNNADGDVMRVFRSGFLAPLSNLECIIQSGKETQTSPILGPETRQLSVHGSVGGDAHTGDEDDLASPRAKRPCHGPFVPPEDAASLGQP